MSTNNTNKRSRKSNNNAATTSSKRGKTDAATIAAAGGSASTTMIPRPDFRDAKNLAATLLGWLPPDSTNKTKDSKTLLRAMDIVRAELDHKTQLKSHSSIEDGRQSDILLGNVSIPPDVFINVLSYLKPASEMVHAASLVTKSWLAATRSPQLWDTLDNDHGMPASTEWGVTNMDHLLSVLRRPQFASLKTLVPPDKVQLRAKAPGQIAKYCPLLEHIDFGLSLWSNMKIDDNALAQLPSLFPHLKSIGFYSYKVTDFGIQNFCRRMGDRLVSLRIRDSFNAIQKLSDNTLIECIAQHCPNLERFEYEYSNVGGTPEPALSEKGVIGLLDGCPKLSHIALIDITDRALGTGAFRHLVDMNKDLRRLYVVENCALMRDLNLCEELQDNIESLDIITKREHSRRISMKRRAGVIHNDW